MKRTPPAIIAEVVTELGRGASPRELAMRFGISQGVVRDYRNGRRRGEVGGRPKLLSEEDERACFEAWSKCEAGLYELAAIFEVHAETMRNALKRQLGKALEQNHRELSP